MTKYPTLTAAMMVGLFRQLQNDNPETDIGSIELVLKDQNGDLVPCAGFEFEEVACNDKEGLYYRLGGIPVGAGPQRLRTVAIMSTLQDIIALQKKNLPQTPEEPEGVPEETS